MRIHLCDLDLESEETSCSSSSGNSDGPTGSAGTKIGKTFATVTPKSSASRQVNQGNDCDEEDDIISPRKNPRSVLLSEDEEEHIVRLDLGRQAREEKLEGLINIGVAERSRHVPDKLRTVHRMIDNRLVSSVEPVADHGLDLPSTSRKNAADKHFAGENVVDNSEDEEASFIVSDNATPSYRESATTSSSSDSSSSSESGKNSDSATAAGAAAVGHSGRSCRCLCSCPACRRCEFKGRLRWKKQQRNQRKEKSKGGCGGARRSRNASCPSDYGGAIGDSTEQSSSDEEADPSYEPSPTKRLRRTKK